MHTHIPKSVSLLPTFNCFQPFLTLLKCCGVNIDPQLPQTSASVAAKCYHLLIVLLCTYYSMESASHIYFMIAGTAKMNFLFIFYNQHFVCIAILDSFSSHRRKIEVTLRKISHLLEGSSNCEILCQNTRRCSVRLTVFCIGMMVAFILLSATFRGCCSDPNFLKDSLAHYKFGIHFDETWTGRIFFFGTELPYVLIMACLQSYTALIVFETHELYLLFRQLNLEVKTLIVDCSDLSTVYERHDQLARLVDGVNSCFSSIVFVMLISQTGQFVTGIDTMIRVASNRMLQSVANYIDVVFMSVNSLTRFLMLTLTATMLYTEARDITNVLFQVSLHTTNFYQTELKELCKNSHLTALFISQRAIIPVGITPMGLFTINLNLVAVVTLSQTGRVLSAICVVDLIKTVSAFWCEDR